MCCSVLQCVGICWQCVVCVCHDVCMYVSQDMRHANDRHDQQRRHGPCRESETPQYTATHTATHCNTLQHAATKQQHTATHGNPLQHLATLCNTRQHTTTNCKTLQHAARAPLLCSRLHTYTRVHICNTLQHTATHCNTLQQNSNCSAADYTPTHVYTYACTRRNTENTYVQPHTYTRKNTRNTYLHTQTYTNTTHLIGVQGCKDCIGCLVGIGHFP